MTTVFRAGPKFEILSRNSLLGDCSPYCLSTRRGLRGAALHCGPRPSSGRSGDARPATGLLPSAATTAGHAHARMVALPLMIGPERRVHRRSQRRESARYRPCERVALSPSSVSAPPPSQRLSPLPPMASCADALSSAFAPLLSDSDCAALNEMLLASMLF